MFIKTFTSVLILSTLVLGSCSSNSNTASDPVASPSDSSAATEVEATPTGDVLMSSDQQSQIMVPKGWAEDRELHDSAELQASKRSGEMYVIVLSENKADFQDLSMEQHSEITRGLLMENLTEPEVTGPTEVKDVAGNPAIQYRIDGSIDGINVAYLHTTVETPTKYHQILAWTLPSKFDQNQAELQGVIQSFKEAQAAAPTQTSSPAAE